MKTPSSIPSSLVSTEHGFISQQLEVPDSSVLKKVTHFALVLTAKDCNPEKYAAFTRCRMYLKPGSPVKTTESYVAVLTTGVRGSEELGSPQQGLWCPKSTAGRLYQRHCISVITPKQKLSGSPPGLCPPCRGSDRTGPCCSGTCTRPVIWSPADAPRSRRRSCRRGGGSAL